MYYNRQVDRIPKVVDTDPMKNEKTFKMPTNYYNIDLKKTDNRQTDKQCTTFFSFYAVKTNNYSQSCVGLDTNLNGRRLELCVQYCRSNNRSDIFF